MKVKTNIKAGGMSLPNHNEAIVREKKARGLKVKSSVRAGGAALPNHNEAIVRDGTEG